MPYQTREDLPQDIKAMPQDAQQIYMAAYNSIESGAGQEQAQKVAWDTVTQDYAKREDGTWYRKPDDSGEHSPLGAASQP